MTKKLPTPISVSAKIPQSTVLGEPWPVAGGVGVGAEAMGRRAIIAPFHVLRGRVIVSRVSGRREYLCYTDGSCKAGDGAPGGWGFCIRPPSGPPVEGHGKARGTVAKVMEYQAVAEALAALPDGASAIVFCDNQSLVENCASGRLGVVARADPLLTNIAGRIEAYLRDKRLVVSWQWVRAHNGNAGNERADSLAALGAREAKVEVAAELRQGRTSTRR